MYMHTYTCRYTHVHVCTHQPAVASTRHGVLPSFRSLSIFFSSDEMSCTQKKHVVDEQVVQQGRWYEVRQWVNTWQVQKQEGREAMEEENMGTQAPQRRGGAGRWGCPRRRRVTRRQDNTKAFTHKTYHWSKLENRMYWGQGTNC